MVSLRIFLVAAAFSAAAVSYAQNGEYSGSDPVGTVSYCLPSTTLCFNVTAVRETFHAGPYAAYASKYLGIDVPGEDAVSYTITEVKMTPYMEADQSRRYLLELPGPVAEATFLKMTTCGLVCTVGTSLGKETSWRFPMKADGDFSEMAVSSNFESEATSLNRTGNGRYDKVPVRQNMIVEKSLEKRAAETAKLIFGLREKRLQIITGDTDATYSGEAMGAAVEELTRLEKEYMTMFTGYSEYQEQNLNFELVPQKGRSSQMYVAFRLSDTAGLLSADNLSGKPIVLEINPQEPVAAPVPEAKAKQDKNTIYAVYRIPAICSVRLTDGSNTLFQTRIPIWQFGFESTIPVQKLK